MNPYTDIEEARLAVEQFDGSPADFLLPVSDELQDTMGIAIAIVTDAVLAKGWAPNGFDQQDGYRVYKYKWLD